MAANQHVKPIPRIMSSSIEIKQDYKYVGDEWWEWWAWIDGEEDELDAVDSVTWILHPTFKEPIQVSIDRRSKFRLNTSGWGIFTLKAKVKYKDMRNETRLAKEIELYYPDGKRNLE